MALSLNCSASEFAVASGSGAAYSGDATLQLSGLPSGASSATVGSSDARRIRGGAALDVDDAFSIQSQTSRRAPKK